MHQASNHSLFLEMHKHSETQNFTAAAYQSSATSSNWPKEGVRALLLGGCQLTNNAHTQH